MNLHETDRYELALMVAEARLRFHDRHFREQSIQVLVNCAHDTAKFLHCGDSETTGFTTDLINSLVARFGPSSVLEKLAKLKLKEEAEGK